MVSQDQIRQLALALPEVVEPDHHGRPSFRVAGRTFATLGPDLLVAVAAVHDPTQLAWKS